MKISVVIPTYNRRNLLKRAIDSVRKQTLNPFEIIVVDDGSIDGTQAWLEDEFPFVKCIYQNNSGVSRARNNGIRSAQGSWIALLDSDDEWLPDKLEQQVKLVRDIPEVLFCHTNEIWIRNGVRVNQMKKHQKYGGDIFEKCLDMCRISPSSSIIKKEIFDTVGLFDESLHICEDYDLWLRITSKFSISYLDKPLIVKYGGHSDQLSKASGGIEKYRILSLEKILNSLTLTESQAFHAREMLIKKLNIYVNGLKKRCKYEELKLANQKIKYWSEWET